jgi:hypothetical protein
MSERPLTARLGAPTTVVERIAHRTAELAHAFGEGVVCVARLVLEELDQGEHLACVDDLDRPARSVGVHTRGDRLRRRRLQRARLEFLADAPRHFDLAAADVEVDAIGSHRHCRRFVFAACALARLDAHDLRGCNELPLAAVDFDPALLVRPARTA